MRNAKLVFVGAAVAAGLALSASAMAQTRAQMHEMNVTLPDGAVVHVQYAGAKPIVTLGQEPVRSSWSDDGDRLWPAFGADDFKIPDIGAVTARIDHQMAAMRAEMATFDRLSDPNLAANVSSSASRGGFCARTVEVTQTGAAAPHVEEHSYGACADAAHAPAAHTDARAPTRA